MDYLYVFLIIFGVFTISFILINIRHVITGNEFRGTCASANPALANEMGECGGCGKKATDECENKHHHNVKDELEKSYQRFLKNEKEAK